MGLSFGFAPEGGTVGLSGIEDGWDLFSWGDFLGDVEFLQADYYLIGDWTFSWAASFGVYCILLVLHDVGLEDVTGLAIVLDDIADVAEGPDLFDDHLRLDWGKEVEDFFMHG